VFVTYTRVPDVVRTDDEEELALVFPFVRIVSECLRVRNGQRKIRYNRPPKISHFSV